jgi:hypothetical protein
MILKLQAWLQIVILWWTKVDKVGSDERFEPILNI